MSLKKQRNYLAILDVGHGNAAVLCDEGGTVVFDAGRQATVNSYLMHIREVKIEALFLSHADVDHIGGAITLLLNPKLKIKKVFLNPDPSKDTEVFRQLRFALCDAQERNKTKIEASLTTTTVLPRKGAKIEVLYPSPVHAIGGVGGRDLKGRVNTSNSLSAAIRVTHKRGHSILLGGDIEFTCLDEWKKSSLNASATALVFPHHGGLPGHSDEMIAALFAHEITKAVVPLFIIFSIHRTLHENPRDAILSAIVKAKKEVRFICTQLPDRFHAAVNKGSLWEIHCGSKPKLIEQGTVEIAFGSKCLRFKFVKSE